MPTTDYYLKFFILFAATFTSIFLIWFALIREESVDWISSQVTHQVSPYAVSSADDGTVTIDNVLADYEFTLPAGFKTPGARNLTFYLERDGVKKCEIRHFYKKPSRGEISADDLTFELIDKSQSQDCGGYLRQIRASLHFL